MRWLTCITACLGLLSCRFDASVPPDVNVACFTNRDCPSGKGCQQPTRRCAPTVPNDVAPPRVVASSVAYTSAEIPAVTALGLEGRATVVVEPDEPLSNEPVLEPGQGLACERPRWVNARLEFDCLVADPSAVTQGERSLSLSLFDLSGNGARVVLDAMLDVDTVPPAPLAGPLVLSSSQFSLPAFRGLKLAADERLVGHRLLARVDALTLALTPPLDGGAQQVELERRGRLEVLVVDSAGNRSTPTPISQLRENLRGPLSRHKAILVNRLGPALAYGNDWFASERTDERSEAQTRAVPFGDADAWVHHRFALPSADVRFVASVDDGEVMAFSQLGSSAVFRYGQGGFEPLSNVSSQVGLPPPARGAAFGYDRVSHVVVRVGGEPTLDTGMSQDWILSRAPTRWQRIGTPAESNAVVDAMLEWTSEGLMLMGGLDRATQRETAETKVFEGRRFGASPHRLPFPLRRAATTFDTTTRTTWLFGGERDGGLSADLLAFTSARGFERIAARAPWPQGAQNQALAAEQGTVWLLQEDPSSGLRVWAYDSDGGFSSRGAASLPIVRPSLGWDLERRGFIALGEVSGQRQLWFIDPKRPDAAKLLKRDTTAPRARLGASVTGAGARAWLAGGLIEGNPSDEVWEADPTGWRQLDAGFPGGARHAAWLDPMGRLVTVGGVDSSGPLSGAWHFDGLSWSAPGWNFPGVVGEAAGGVLQLRGVVLRAGSDRLLRQTVGGNFQVDPSLVVDPAWARPQVVSSGTTLYFVGERDGGSQLAEVKASGVELITSVLGGDYAWCDDPLRRTVIAVNGEAQGTELDGTFVLTRGFDGARRFEPQFVADSYGDRIPTAARGSRMFLMNGHCWLANNDPRVELWELESEPGNGGLIFELDVDSLEQGGQRQFTVTAGEDVDCWVHVDGAWLKLSRGRTCTVEERYLSPKASIWRLAITELVDRRPLSVPAIEGVGIAFIESTLE